MKKPTKMGKYIKSYSHFEKSFLIPIYFNESLMCNINNKKRKIMSKEEEVSYNKELEQLKQKYGLI